MMTRTRRAVALAACAVLMLALAACQYEDGTPIPMPDTVGVPTGTTLTPYTGPLVIDDSDDPIIDAKVVTGCLNIRRPDVFITRSLILCDSEDQAAITQETGWVGDTTGLVIAQNEIRPATTNGWLRRAVYLQDGGATVEQNYIHGMISGVYVGSNTVVDGNFIGQGYHPACHPPEPQPCDEHDGHSTLVAANGGVQNVVVSNNHLQIADNTNASSAVSFYAEAWAGGPTDNVSIEGNLMYGDALHCAYPGHSPNLGESPHTNMRFVGNRFGTWGNRPNGCVTSTHISFSNDPSNLWAENYMAELTGPGGETVANVGDPIPPNLVG